MREGGQASRRYRRESLWRRVGRYLEGVGWWGNMGVRRRDGEGRRERNWAQLVGTKALNAKEDVQWKPKEM